MCLVSFQLKFRARFELCCNGAMRFKEFDCRRARSNEIAKYPSNRDDLRKILGSQQLTSISNDKLPHFKDDLRKTLKSYASNVSPIISLIGSSFCSQDRNQRVTNSYTEKIFPTTHRVSRRYHLVKVLERISRILNSLFERMCSFVSSSLGHYRLSI